MKSFFVMLLLLAMPASSEEDVIKGPAKYPVGEATYVVSGWKYVYSVVDPGTRFQGCWGRMYYDSKELSAPVHTVVTTPVGDFIFLGGLDVKGYGPHGWFNTLRDYSGNPRPAFQPDGSVAPGVAAQTKRMTVAQLLEFNRGTEER